MLEEKLIYDDVDGIVDKTIDCEDPSFASNANCLEYSYGDSKVESSNVLYFYILGGIIFLMLFGLIISKMMQWHKQNELMRQQPDLELEKRAYKRFK